MMKKFLILVIFLAFWLTGMNLKAEDPIKVAPFHSIIVSSEIKAELVLSREESIEIQFDQANTEDLIAEVKDSVLTLRMRTGRYKDSDLKVRINYRTDPRMLEANGRAQIWSEEDMYLDGSLTVKLFNGGEMRFRLYCDSLDATVSQGAVIYLEGETRALNVKANTNATFSGYEFESETAVVTAGSTGKAKVSVSRYLNARATAKGFIGYVGEPEKVDEETSMMGEIVKTFLE